MMRKLEAFCGVRIATYCLMGNHFHLLVEVPDKESVPKLDAESLLRLLPLLYDSKAVDSVAQELAAARRAKDESWEAAILARFERRRGDLSVFLKELKQRVSIYMNHRLERTGTLWEGRFKSVLVEGGEPALLAVAAYIDLNPVRAKLVEKPEDYRWSGYGEACGAGRRASLAREGLASIQREALSEPGCEIEWSTAQERYRNLLRIKWAEREATEAAEREAASPGPGPETADSSGEIPSMAEALRRQVRYFTDGAVIGSAAFVNEVFSRMKAAGRTGPNRKSGARRMRGAHWEGLHVLRDLRVRAMGPPPD